ncbi:MAG: hypothetical protein GTO67_14640 [Gammaproteobacteria bacterium]|nr:hypothetical protein [Gammaproteobacteria bacterium]NIM72287.1 hypothetical protein [Gammaproteobacteria bacterium]NIN39797.1 hypothetical protein [Gammaproteobacteria bacterium]NIO24046.1 hypothetical protein [Gammaproteobacteria bacterium]NIO64696.1 hypothetical protein [Gammaproteobacteria bacterium]
MRTTFLATMLSASAALLSTQALADPVKRVLPQGKDGNDYYYKVLCTNGAEGSVVVQEKENNVCAQPLGGERVCDAGWDVQRAAEHACR